MMTFKFRPVCRPGRYIIILLLPVFLISSAVYSQDALKYLKIKGMIVENNENTLEGAKAILYKNSVKIDEKYTSKDGKFFFTLELNQRYLVEVSKPYFITKKISFSTTVPPDIKVIYPYKFTINIFKYIEGIDYSVLKKPIAHVKYYSEENKFDYDEDYTNSIMAKLEKLYEQITQKEIEMEEEAGKQKPLSGSPKMGESASAQDKQSEKEIYEGIDRVLTIEPGTPPPKATLHPPPPVGEGPKGESQRAGTPFSPARGERTKVSPQRGDGRGAAGDVIYKMQIAASRKPIPLIAANFNGLKDVDEYFDNGLYKYTVGETTDYKYVINVLKERIRNLGFKNSFVVSFKDGKRIHEKYKDENISTKLKEDKGHDTSVGVSEEKDIAARPDRLSKPVRPISMAQEQKTKAFLGRKNAEFETKELKKQMEEEREMDRIQEIKDKLAMAKSRKIFLEEIADSKRTMKKRAGNSHNIRK